MLHQILRLTTILKDIRKRGLMTPLEPPQILLITRQVLEASKEQHVYPVVNLYANWCAHVKIDKSSLGYQILLEASKMLARDFKSLKPGLVDPSSGISRLLALSQFRQQLNTLFAFHRIPSWIFATPSYSLFIGAILDSIAEKPISFPPNLTGRARKIHTKIKQATDDNPKAIVTELFVTNQLKKEQLDFFKVPQGTYVWTLTTEYGFQLRSVLYES